MEMWLDVDLVLAATFFLAFILEIIRFQSLYPLKLNLTWTGGWRFAYYMFFLAIVAGIGPALATVLTYLLTLLWRYFMALPSPAALYASGLFLVFLAGAVALLLYMALVKVQTLRELLPRMGILTLVSVACFAVEPLRWLFGATLVVLVTSAIGELVRFTGWNDLAQWLDQPAEEADAPGKRNAVRVHLFLEAEGSLERRGDRIELHGEELASPDDNRVAALARRLLDRTRLTEIVAAMDETRHRDDLLAEVAPLIARNLSSLYAYQQSISLEKGATEDKEKKVVGKVQEILDVGLGEQLRSLLYWHYDLPQDTVQLAVCRVPHVELKPLLSLKEYLGLFLSRYARRAKR